MSFPPLAPPSLLPRVSRAAAVLRDQGLRWAGYRAWHHCLEQTGAYRRSMPPMSWSEISLESRGGGKTFAERWLAAPPPFLFDIQEFRETFGNAGQWPQASDASDASDAMSGGQQRLFGHAAPAEFPPDWHVARTPPNAAVSSKRSPCSGTTGDVASDAPWAAVAFPADEHWSTIDAFSRCDIKWLWEPARLGAACTFVRASVHDPRRRDTHLERFWQLADSFYVANPPNRGAHWKCGQELALRLLAWTFGLYGSLGSPVLTPQRVAQTAQYASAAAERIERHIHYALSQRNNHGISEAAGLLTAGLLFPQLVAADRWSATGARLLRRQCNALIYADGGFSQHSANYHRLMLQVLVWCVRLADVSGFPLPAEVAEGARRATRFLLDMLDDVSGELPNYGENDGALALPLANSSPRDFRPSLQCASVVLDGRSALPAGPWDEETLWITGRQPPAAVSRPPSGQFSGLDGGCHVLRSRSGLAVMRCVGDYRHRPGHADSLHVDIRWRGLNVALDPGTFSYNAPAPWDHPLVQARYHNVVTVDGQEPMTRAGRFLWTDWHRGQVTRRQGESGDPLALWEGSHDGFRRAARRLQGRAAVCYRRAVMRVGDEHWLVVDDLRSAAAHRYRLHWLLLSAPHTQTSPGAGRHRIGLDTTLGRYEMLCLTDNSASVAPHEFATTVGDPSSPDGWACPGYSQRTPAIAATLRIEDSCVRLLTLLGPPPHDMQLTGAPSALEVQLPTGRASIQLIESAPGPVCPPAAWDRQPLVQSAQWRPHDRHALWELPLPGAAAQS